MILLLKPQIEIATSKANKIVKAIKIGNANFRKVYTQHPITQDNAIKRTDKIIIAGVLTKICWKVGLLYPIYPIITVTNSCKESKV